MSSHSNPQFALPAAGERLRCGGCGNLTRLWASAGAEPAEQ